MKNNGSFLTCLPGDTPGIIVVLLEAVLIHTTRNAGLVKSFDGSYNISVSTISRSKSLKGLLGVFNGVTLLPGDSTTLSAVVKTVLRSRGWDKSVNVKQAEWKLLLTYRRAGQPSPSNQQREPSQLRNRDTPADRQHMGRPQDAAEPSSR